MVTGSWRDLNFALLDARSFYVCFVSGLDFVELRGWLEVSSKYDGTKAFRINLVSIGVHFRFMASFCFVTTHYLLLL